MDSLTPRSREHLRVRAAPRLHAFPASLLVAALIVGAAGCHQMMPLDTKPLDSAGMSYDTIQELKSLQITAPEVTELAKARAGGYSDAGCVDTVKIFRSRNQPFDTGDTIAGLIRAGVSEDTILELAKMNQLGLGSGEFQAMKLAGLSDAIILEVARHRAAAMPVLAGASLAELKNSGLRQSTLLELARRGIPDSQADAIVSSRRHGASDADILGRFTGS
jgi:hypothetical protein